MYTQGAPSLRLLRLVVFLKGRHVWLARAASPCQEEGREGEGGWREEIRKGLLDSKSYASSSVGLARIA